MEKQKGCLPMSITFPTPIDTVEISSGPNKTIFYPQATIIQDDGLQRYVNQTIMQKTQELINQQVDEMPSTVVEMLGSYELKNNQRQVLSLSLTNYTYHYHAAHGMTYKKSLTFDLDNGTLPNLKDLFKPGSDYITRISDLIKLQIKERDIQLLTDFTTIQPNQDFYVADKTLVIYFQLYEITPYVFGFPMFPISIYDLQDIIIESGPLGRMI